MKKWIALAACAAGFALGTPVLAQKFPAGKPVRIIVPFAPGGSSDRPGTGNLGQLLALPHRAQVIANSPAEMDKFLREDRARWAKVIQETGLKLEQ